MKIKYLTWHMLQQAAKEARRAKLVYQLSEDEVNNLSPETRFPIISHTLHGDGPNVRARIALSERRTVMLDMPLQMFNVAPEVEIEEESDTNDTTATRS